MKKINRVHIFVYVLIISTTFSCRTKYTPQDLFQNEASENLFKYGQKEQDLGNLKKALVLYNQADSLAPNTPIILHERGLLKSQMGNYKDAILDLNLSILLTTTKTELQLRLNNRGLTYLQMNNLEKACSDWSNSGIYGKSYVKKYCTE